MTLAWVLGSAGLLGTALCKALRGDGRELFVPAPRFPWDDGLQLRARIGASVREFALRTPPGERWEIFWAAGVGTMSSAAESLATETQALAWLLEFLQADPQLMAAGGTLAFASSAGAIYAGSADEIITENSPAAPTTAYAREKLRQEGLLRDFVAANAGTSALIARISTLYGCGAAHGKKQGLLGHMARSILQHRPVQIYVPYDTIRDYIDADDAAAAMVRATSAMPADGRVVTKIIASECPVTIAEIVSIFKRLARRGPQVVRSANLLSELYSRRVQFKSVVALSQAAPPPKRLPVGIAQLLSAERTAYVRGATADRAPQ